MSAEAARVNWQRHRFTVLFALAGLIAAFGVAATLARAGTGPAAQDYAQCSNGPNGSTPATDCAWINGILNANNSQFHEDQVTPQRLLVTFTDTGGSATDYHTHSVTLRYLARKGTIHAYDSLSSANATVSDALTLRCLGLSSSLCPGATAPSDSTPIVPDPTPVPPETNASLTNKTQDHQLAGMLNVYGAVFTNLSAGTVPMTTPTHDNACANCGDDYASTTISFATQGKGAHNVQLLFGGHLAAGTQDRGWGTGLGASSVSGGPYHIKWDAADGASVGNRDNQIMSNAILPIVPVNTQISTAPAQSSTAPLSYNDVATLTDVNASHPPAGETVTFDLYGPFTTANPPSSTVNNGAANCVDPVNGSGGNEVTTVTGTVSSASPWTATSASVDMSSQAAGIYQWVAHYPGDTYNNPIDGTCGDNTEWIATTGLHTTPSPSSAGVGATSLATASDSATLTISSGNAPTGDTVTFDLYGPFATGTTSFTCTDPPTTGANRVAHLTGTVTASADVPPVYSASPSSTYDLSGAAPGIYQWIARFPGDAHNLPVSGSCGDEPVTITKATPGGTSAQTVTDTVALTGQYVPSGGTLGGTVNFYVYPDNTCTDGADVFHSLNRSITNGFATSAGFTPANLVPKPAAGSHTYYWKVTYSGDTYNNSTTLESCQVEVVSIQDAAS